MSPYRNCVLFSSFLPSMFRLTDFSLYPSGTSVKFIISNLAKVRSHQSHTSSFQNVLKPSKPNLLQLIIPAPHPYSILYWRTVLLRLYNLCRFEQDGAIPHPLAIASISPSIQLSLPNAQSISMNLASKNSLKNLARLSVQFYLSINRVFIAASVMFSSQITRAGKKFGTVFIIVVS